MHKSILDKLDLVNAWAGKLASLFLVLIIVIVCYEIIMRYILNAPTTWATELSGLLLMVYIMLGGGYTLLLNEHVRVDVIFERLSVKQKTIIDMTITTVIVLFFIGVLFWFSSQIAVDSVLEREISSSGLWRGQIWPFKLSVPIGAFLVAFQWVLGFIRNWQILNTRKTEAVLSPDVKPT